MRNLKATLRYDGTDFAGWQVQPELPTVQGTLMEVLHKITGEPVKLTGAGRTDAGVHALGQVANLKTSSNITTRNLIRAINSMVAPRIRVDELEDVPEEFDARRDARSKVYRYAIQLADFPDPLVFRYCWQLPFELNIESMSQAAQYLLGKHDFSSFRASAGKDRSPMRTVYSLEIRTTSCSFPNDARNDVVSVEICADGFVHKMVRNIVGTLVEVGRGKIVPERLKEILEGRDRQLAGLTAAARGLCLVSVQYS